MTNYTEEDLYNACMRYCKFFTLTVCEQNKNQQRKLYFEDDMITEPYKQHEEQLKIRLKDEFLYLCEIVEVLKNGKGNI